jgi:hypothetical protein
VLAACGGSDRPEAFCRETAAAQEEFGDLAPDAFTDPAAIRRVLARMERIAGEAPEEVRPDVAVVVDGLRELVVFVESGGTEPGEGRFDFAAFQRAFERLEDFEEEACGEA